MTLNKNTPQLSPYAVLYLGNQGDIISVNIFHCINMTCMILLAEASKLYNCQKVLILLSSHELYDILVTFSVLLTADHPYPTEKCNDDDDDDDDMKHTVPQRERRRDSCLHHQMMTTTT